MTRRGLCLVVSLVVAIAVARPAGAQAPPPDPQTTPPSQTPPPSQATTAQTTTQPALPVDVDKIRTALSRPQSLQIDNQSLRFYLEIRPAPVTFMSWVRNFDLMNGPVPGSAVTGADLANMMTPREMYSSAGITATDMLQFAATNFAAQTLIRRAVNEIKHAKDQKQVADIQAKIDHELAAMMVKDDKDK